MPSRRCAECGAAFIDEQDSCAARFYVLLALDHSRREPWGSRHGQAFAAFALQHPSTYAMSLDVAWTTLHRIYCQGEAPARVFASVRRTRGAATIAEGVPARPSRQIAQPTITIADLGEFPTAGYPEALDAWCRATLVAWGATFDAPAA